MITPFGLSAEQTDQVLSAACRAPSLHNSQPWAFRIGADRIEVHKDASRALHAADPDGREARLACGAALFNLRLALAQHGVMGSVTIGSDPGSSLVAVIERGSAVLMPGPEVAELGRAIGRRRTNRQPFFDAAVPVAYHHVLARAAEGERASLQVVGDPGRLAHLRQWAASAHLVQSADAGWAAEWAKWTGRTDTGDGVPKSAAGPAPSAADIWTLRDFGHPGRPDRFEGKQFEQQPLIAVIATATDGPQAQIRAGQAMQRVLLTATNLGLAASFVSQLIEVGPVRDQLHNLLGGRLHPQVVLRLGFGAPVPRTPRRPVQDCLLLDTTVQA